MMKNFDDANYLLGSVDLGRTYNLKQGSTWAPGLSVRQSMAQVPGRHGSIYAGKALFDAEPMNFDLVIQSTTAAGLDNERNKLLQMLTAPGLKLTRVNGANKVTADVVLKSVTEASEFMVNRRARFKVTLVNPSGVFLGAAQSTSLGVTSGSAGYAAAWVSASSAPIMNLTVEAAGPLTHLEVRDTVTGAWLRLPNAGVTTTDKVTIHTGNLTATVGTTDVSAKLERHPEFLGFQAVGGYLRVNLFRTGTGSATVTTKFNHHFF